MANKYIPLSEIKKESEFVAQVQAKFDEQYSKTRAFRTKCTENEELWKNNNWKDVTKKVDNEPQPNTPVLYALVENTLADVMDNYPESAIRGTVPEHDTKGAIINEMTKFLFQRIRFKNKYRTNIRNNLKRGLSVFQVIWDKSVDNGFGDIDILNIDPKNFVWDTSADTIQECEFVATVKKNPESYFAVRYPKQYRAMTFGDTKKNDEYQNDETKTTDTDDKLARTIDFFWKEEVLTETGIVKTTVHYAKIAGGQLLKQELNLYEFGLYPFVAIPCFKLEGDVAGIGLIDIFKSEAKLINQLDQFIAKNAWRASKPKLLVQEDSGIDENELADGDKEIITGKDIHEGAVRELTAEPLPYAIMRHYETKQLKVKEYAAQNDFATGATSAGVTAGRAIDSLREASQKRLRLLIDQYYEYYDALVLLVVFFQGKYYDDKKTIRISKKAQNLLAEVQDVEINGEAVTIDFSQFKVEGVNANYDITCTPQRHNPTTTATKNQLAIDLRQLGVLDPLGAVKMMEFDDKDEVVKQVEERMAIEQTIAQQQQMIEQLQAKLQQVQKNPPPDTRGQEMVQKIQNLG